MAPRRTLPGLERVSSAPSSDAAFKRYTALCELARGARPSIKRRRNAAFREFIDVSLAEIDSLIASFGPEVSR